MALDFPNPSVTNPWLDAPNGVVYTYIGTPPNGYWTGSTTEETSDKMDERYVQVAGDNILGPNPLTFDTDKIVLNIDGTAEFADVTTHAGGVRVTVGEGDGTNFGFVSENDAPNFFGGDTYIGGSTSRNTRELWESTLTEEQQEQLTAGTLAIPANVSTPGDGSFARQWWYDQQSAEDQALIDSGELEYPENFQAANFVDTFALGQYTNINLVSNGLVGCKSVEVNGGLDITTGITLFGTNKERLMLKAGGTNVAQFLKNGQVTLGFDGVETDVDPLQIRQNGGGTNGGVLKDEDAFITWAPRNANGTPIEAAKFGPVFLTDAGTTNNIACKFSFHLNSGGGLDEKVYINENGGFFNDNSQTAADEYSIFAGGTAPNYFAGDTYIGGLNEDDTKVKIGSNGTASLNAKASDFTATDFNQPDLINACVAANVDFSGSVNLSQNGFAFFKAVNTAPPAALTNAARIIGYYAGESIGDNGCRENIGFYSEVYASGSDDIDNYNFQALGDAPNYFVGDIWCDGAVDGAISLRMETDNPGAFQTVYSTNSQGEIVTRQKYIGPKEDLLSIIKDLRARVEQLEAAVNA